MTTVWHKTIFGAAILASVLLGLAGRAAAHLDHNENYDWHFRATHANAGSYDPSVGDSAVAYWSTASDLVSGDTNGVADIFLTKYDHSVHRISVSSSGAQANDWSTEPAMTPVGRFIAFTSGASNLVAGDTNVVPDVFVRDLINGTTERISISSSGVAANGWSGTPSISADGRYVAFQSSATNLVANDTNGRADIFVRDRTTATTTRVSLARMTWTCGSYYGYCMQRAGSDQPNQSSFSPAISADGRYVAFSSTASNLVPSDTNGLSDVFIRDLQTQTTTRASLNEDGTQLSKASYAPSLSGDGKFVAFEVLSPPAHSDIWFRYLVSTSTRPNGRNWVYSYVESSNGCRAPSLSPSAAFLAFDCQDTEGLSDVIVMDSQRGGYDVRYRSVVNRTFRGAANGSARSASVSDAAAVAFASDSTDLTWDAKYAPDDTNRKWDVFVHSSCVRYGCTI